MSGLLCHLAVIPMLFARGQEPTGYDLGWRPKTGSTVDYRLSHRDEVDGHAVQASGRLRMTVTGVTPSKGYAVRAELFERTSDTEGGHLQPEDVGDVWLESGSREDADIERLAEFGPTATLLTARFADHAAKVGDEWTTKMDGVDQRFKLISTEAIDGVPALKLTVHAVAGKITTDGTYWLRVGDSRLLRAETRRSGTIDGPDEHVASFRSVSTADLLFEWNGTARKPADQAIKLQGEVPLRLKELYGGMLGSRTEPENYGISFEEFRDSYVLLIRSKPGISTEKFPRGFLIELEFNKKDGKFARGAVDPLEATGSDSR